MDEIAKYAEKYIEAKKRAGNHGESVHCRTLWRNRKMTIDEAIRYADTLAWNTSEGLDRMDVRVFGMLCRDALRLAKKMKEGNATWQNRMKHEYCETKERYEKLHKMVTKYEAGTLGFTPNCSLELLCQQKRHMGEYLHDLEIRAEIEGVNLYD